MKATIESKPELSVLIATHNPAGIKRVEAMALPEMSGVGYIVSWQQHDNAPVPHLLAIRNDMRIHRSSSQGLSNNRNELLDMCNGEIALIADDDITYSKEQLQAIIDTFKNNPDVDYASFMYDGADKKNYPSSITCLTDRIPKGFYQSSIEIALRPKQIGNLRFNTNFGIGSKLFPCGEEDIFLWTARKKKLNCVFFPITITTHPHLSTGNKLPDFKILRAKGAVTNIYHPISFLARIPVMAWQMKRAGKAKFFSAITNMFFGAFYIRLNPKIKSSIKTSLTSTHIT